MKPDIWTTFRKNNIYVFTQSLVNTLFWRITNFTSELDTESIEYETESNLHNRQSEMSPDKST